MTEGNGAIMPDSDDREDRIEALQAQVDQIRERGRSRDVEIDKKLLAIRDQCDALTISLGYTRETAERADEGKRDLQSDVGKITGELGRLNDRLDRQDKRFDKLEELIGRWPQGPDDTGSGLAGRVAAASVPDIVVVPPQPPAQGGETIPPPFRSIARWAFSRSKLLGFAVLVLAAVITALIEGLR